MDETQKILLLFLHLVTLTAAHTHKVRRHRRRRRRQQDGLPAKPGRGESRGPQSRTRGRQAQSKCQWSPRPQEVAAVFQWKKRG